MKFNIEIYWDVSVIVFAFIKGMSCENLKVGSNIVCSYNVAKIMFRRHVLFPFNFDFFIIKWLSFMVFQEKPQCFVIDTYYEDFF